MGIWRPLLLLLTALLVPLAHAEPGTSSSGDSSSNGSGEGAAGFGRWETLLRDCRVQGQTEGCIRLRLDQTIEGLLRVRFISSAEGGRYASQELIFAGLLLKQDQPMQCQQGQCTPQWPMRLQVHGVSERQFNPRGLAAQMPSIRLAQGSCSLGPTRLQCQAKGRSGERWSASGDLSGFQPASATRSEGS